MKVLDKTLFQPLDHWACEAMKHRQRRHEILASNIANSQVPGYRAIGYRFEDQLRAAQQSVSSPQNVMKTSHPSHFVQAGLNQNGQVKGELFTRATESIGMDGNTVDLESEMMELAENQIMHRATVEVLSRRWALLKYAIHGGRL